MLAVMERLKNYAGPYDLEFIPFNGEDSPMVKGQITYLNQYGKEMGNIRLAVNVEAVGAKGSKSSVSTYNVGEDRQVWLDAEIGKFRTIERGPEWVDGDHSIFVFRGVPCLAITSSNMRDEVMSFSHSTQDSVAHLDRELLVEAANFIVDLVVGF